MKSVGQTSRHRDWIDSARQTVEEAEGRSTAALTRAGGRAAMSRASLPPDFFPGYTLEREIHAGGQGVVYVAIQKSTSRRVALKALRESVFSTPLERARFEREVQVLAALHHPNIVTIHDSGSVAGQFYFVMDFIAGHALDLYVSGRPRSIRELLELFTPVCDAVDAAHVRGIIHRDIKPGNILVDAEGRPHVLDFGLAKVSSQFSVISGQHERELSLASETQQPATGNFTLTGQFVGSLPWSAPEQSEGDAAQIDTRSDVYSLGVVLYQLLTGRFPYNVVGLMRRVQENIAHSQPLRPRSLRRELDDELETIVLKCLSKERDRRYQTAGELARDLRHYLRGEPIEAKRDSGWYMLRKTLTRYRLRMTIAGAFVLLITGATIALLILYAGKASLLLEVERERDKAVAAQRLADDRLQQVEYESYVSNIAASVAAIAAQDGGAALKRLQSTNAALRNWEWRYLNRQADQSVMTWHGPPDLITGRVRLSPDDRYVAASFWMEERDGALRVWLRTSGDAVGESALASGHSSFFEFSGDGEEMLMCDREGTLSRFDLAESRVTGRRSFAALRDGEATVEYWPTEHVLLTMVLGSYHLWDTVTGRLLHELPTRDAWISSRSMDIAGGRLALGWSDGTISLWDIITGRELAQTKTHSDVMYGMAFSPNGRLLATASEGGDLRLWELIEHEAEPENSAVDDQALTLRLVRELPCGEQRIGVISFSSDGTLLAAPSEDKTVRIFSVNDGELRATLLGHTTGVVCTAFGNDGRWLVSGARDGVVKLWDLQQSQPVRAIRELPIFMNSIAFTRDGERFLSNGESVCVIDVASGQKLHEHRLSPVPRGLTDIVTGPDDRQAAFSNQDGTVCIWDAIAGGEPRTIGRHQSMPRLAGHPSARVFASADAEALVLWDWDEGRQVRRFVGPGQAVRCLALSSDATRLALGLGDGELIILDTLTGQSQPNAIEHAHGRSITNIAFTPDGRHLATGSDDGTVKLWDVASGRVLWSAAPQLGDVWCVAISPDGTRLAVGGRDRSVRLLDTGNGQELLALRGPTGTVMSLAFSPDGNRIAAGSHTREVIIWDANPAAAEE